MSRAPLSPPSDNTVRLVDRWADDYGCPCPQSHLLRALGLSRVQLRLHVEWLVAHGVLEWRDSDVTLALDVARAVRP